MKKYVLLTGATGLVGRYLVRDLLLAGHRLAVVVRQSERESAAERMEAILQMWEEQLHAPLPRPVVLEGDITQPRFQLSAEDLRWIQVHCDRILHNAAVLTFYNPDRTGEPWRSNLGGVEYALQLCEQLGIVEFHHTSTAYVAGSRTDRVFEHELDQGQSFRNDYEESKFLAEQLVRSARFLRSLTVYRPAVIAGDSRTGYTSTYHGLYHYFKLMSVLNRNVEPDANGVRHTPLQLQMTGDEPRNVVPVDWVSAAICRIFSTPSAHGRTYHLAPQDRVTPRRIIEAGYRYYNSYGVEFVGPEARSPVPISTLDQAAQENMRLYEPYENSDPEFDISNLQQFLPDLPCPVVDSEMMQRFMAFGESDRWGKRRAPRPTIPFWVSQYLQEELARRQPSDLEDSQESPVVIGLNVYGPGGGQWRLEFREDQLSAVIPGLPLEHASVSLSSADFSRLTQKFECLTAERLQAGVEWDDVLGEESPDRSPREQTGWQSLVSSADGLAGGDDHRRSIG